MNLSALPPSQLLAATGVNPLGAGSVGVGSGRLDATKASSAPFALPLNEGGHGTLHVSPNAPSWTAEQFEAAFVSALCEHADVHR